MALATLPCLAYALPRLLLCYFPPCLPLQNYFVSSSFIFDCIHISFGLAATPPLLPQMSSVACQCGSEENARNALRRQEIFMCFSCDFHNQRIANKLLPRPVPLPSPRLPLFLVSSPPYLPPPSFPAFLIPSALCLPQSSLSLFEFFLAAN